METNRRPAKKTVDRIVAKLSIDPKLTFDEVDTLTWALAQLDLSEEGEKSGGS